MSSSSRNDTRVYKCCYTKHKTQKRKTWHDGLLYIHPNALTLYAAREGCGPKAIGGYVGGSILEAAMMRKSQRRKFWSAEGPGDDEFELEKYLVLAEEG